MQSGWLTEGVVRSSAPILGIATGLVLFAGLAYGEDPIPDEVRFNRDVRPILSNYCFTCHGPDDGQRQTELRLDLEASAVADLGDYHAIVPGKPEESELYRRIVSVDAEQKMPPTDEAKQLSPRQIAVLKKWIEQGAKWEPHWSFVSLERPAVPSPISEWQPVNEIDQYIHARLKEEGLGGKPSPEADRRTLIRRLYFDLLGLPPTAEQVDAFVRDQSPDAYEKLVDQLLADQHFGERLAVWWLDLVRYADSIGYHSDTPRDVWLYRDWVIRSLNENKRFDTFTIEQLAGDLLPNASESQRIASGYNMLLQTTEEGGAQPKEYIVKYAADRVRNVSEVWLAATVGCAECHNHKYDPFTAKDFYSLAAFFADIKEPAVGKRDHTRIYSPETAAKLQQIDAEIAQATSTLKSTSDTEQLTKLQEKWEAETLEKIKTARRDDVAWVIDQHLPANGQKNGDWRYVSKDEIPVHRGPHVRKQQSNGLVQHFVVGASDVITLAEGDMLFGYVYLDPKNPPQQVMLQFNKNGSWEQRAWWGEDRIPYGGNGTNGANHRNLGPLPKAGEWVRLEAPLAEVGLKPGDQLNGIAFTQWGGLAYWDVAGVNSSGLGLPEAVVQAIQTEVAKRTAEKSALITEYVRQNSPELIAAREKLAALEVQKQELQKLLPQTLVTSVQDPRMIRVLPRGNWLDETGEVVNPNTPEFMNPLGVSNRRPTRLDLAKWLIDPQNPMTARAQVNRLWKLYYGHGLARSPSDIGAQGEWPTHPKLLDWLAMEFVESGWDIKHLIKLMVMSRTYRQSSVTTKEIREKDPFNRLYARQSRFRLDAETVRDNALSVSNLLVLDIGGPSVKPYQPAGYWRHLNFPAREWQNGTGKDLYRRGMYTHWQRSFLHPTMLAFDAPSREECTADRPRSNTPQQALSLLNDPSFVEAARVFAERIRKHDGDDAARLAFAYRLALQRAPNEHENNILLKLYTDHLAQYQNDLKEAEAILAVGATPRDKNIPPAELAAWTSVARVILNLHETISRY